MKEKIKIWILALLMLAIVFVIVNPVNAQAGLKYHQKLQKHYSFDRWEKEQPKVRVKAVKSAVKQTKEVKGKNSQSARLVRKENRIRKQIIK
jgi:nicotinamide mononucleotide adenylyltransferase